MLPDSDEVIVEFGLEAIFLAEEFHFECDTNTEQVHTRAGKMKMHTRAGKMKTVTTSQEYSATFKTQDSIDTQSLYRGNGAPEPHTITITGIKEPEVVKLEDALVTSSYREPNVQEIEVIATAAEVDKLW